ncbi:hypothetical protein BOX15_Mlig004434g1 [Macrostomum lignano]|uniref:Uncharacterized protein n=2 Tax=Macrostomum lignano TaxID=282301 RepID=A0A267GU48_9PLAT|nr:hypothetical protein BOX15_Mlig004434g1 [Macrostomum lignano]
MQSQDESEMAQHHILVVPCDRRSGKVPYQALVSVLSWHATRLCGAVSCCSASSAAAGDNADEDDYEDEEAEEVDVNGCGVPAGGIDWHAVAHDGSELSLAELQEAVRDTLAHQEAASASSEAAAASGETTACRLVLVYLDCAPDSLAEAGFLRRLANRGVVVHVFGSCRRARDMGLVGLPHVALHHQDGELSAAQVWALARRRPPASLRPALAIARFRQFCCTDYRLAVSEDFDKLLRAVATSELDQELAAWQVLDYLDERQPQLRVLADGWHKVVDGVDAEGELMTEGAALKNQALRLAKGCINEDAFRSPERLAEVAAAQARLAQILSSGQLVSVPLLATSSDNGGGAVSNDSCAGRFAGVLLVPGLSLGKFGYSARPGLERVMVRRKARFVAGLQAPARTADSINGADYWRIECRRLDEADDCREAVQGLVRLSGCRGKQSIWGNSWSATAALPSMSFAALRMRLRLPADFGEPRAEESEYADTDDEAEEEAAADGEPAMEAEVGDKPAAESEAKEE